VFGASGGSGVLLARDEATAGWSYPAFYTMGSVTFGLQIGGEVSQLVLMVMTQKGLDALLSRSFKIGGDISVAAGPVGKGAKAQTADIVAFSRTKGLYGGLNVEGAVVEVRDSLNKAYYGRKVRPVEILVSGGPSNPGAEALRAAVAEGPKR
jgi:lipid-binding SYLF domain-containing protein